YDISATGFYFESSEQYNEHIKNAVNGYGEPVEEFEIQFIDGDDIDCDLAKAWCLNQCNFGQFFDAVDEWDENQKQHYIIAVGECGYSHNQLEDDPENIDIDIYQLDSLKELAEQFIDDGLFGEIPESIQYYIDYDAVARDLGMDYSETNIAGQNLIYRCA
ncbi:MAG: antirestriction protein ArdA, partial [Rhizobiales bacterium]|nr:antirestriction protein ArdA [Hyphomicrobiales bacterium]